MFALLIGGYVIANYQESLGSKTVVQKAGASEIYPNPALTPGAINPDVTEDNIQQTICVSGWTKTIRPASSYTTNLKKFQLGLTGTITLPPDLAKNFKVTNGYLKHNQDINPADYEEDHLISLELGGHPTDSANLWPEPYTTTPNARNKDAVENYLHKQVCNGSITLAEAQKEISTDWYAVYQTMKGKLGGVSSDADDEGDLPEVQGKG